MNRHLRPALESLEGKKLMTVSPLTAPAGLAYSLSAVEFQSVGHNEVELTLTIKNTSKTSQSVNLAASLDPFVAKQNGKVVWESNAGVSDMAIQRVSLAPGASTQITEIWNETSNIGANDGASVAGAITFDNALDPSDTVTTTIGHQVPSGRNPFTTLNLR